MPDYTAKEVADRIAGDKDMQELLHTDETAFDAKAADIYDTFGYNPDGTPHSTAMKGIKKVSDYTGIPRGIVQGAAQVPIPLATTIAGGVGGSVLGPGGTLAGASMGSVAGEFANYKLGLRDAPGPVDLGIAALAPAIGPVLSRAKGPLSSFAQSLPGAGKTVHNVAADTIKKQIGYMEATPEMVDFMRQNFKNVPTFKADVPMVRQYLQQELDDASKSLTVKYKNVKGTNYQTPTDPYIEKLKTTINNMKGEKNFSFEQLMATEKSFIELGTDNPTGVWRKLSGVLVNDLENQAANPKLKPETRDKILQGVEAYKNYVAVNQRKQGQDALNKFLGEPVLKQLDDGVVRFNKPAFLKQLDSDGMKVFEPSEIADMKKAIENLGYITPKLASVGGAIHTGGYGAAGLAAYAGGSAIGMGGVGGIVGLAAMLGVIRLGLGTPLGRKAIASLAQKGHGTINALELKTMLGQIHAGANAGAVAGVSGMNTQPPPGVQPFANQE